MRESPNLLPASMSTPRNAEIETRLRKAEDQYSAGQRAYQQGDMDAARREFNQAVDILLAAPDNGPERARIENRLEQMVEAIFRYDVNGLGSGEDTDKVGFDKSPLDEVIEMTFPLDPRLKSKVKDEVAATSSQLPLEVNDAVLSYIHFFSSDRGHKILEYGMQRSGRYRPMINRVLDEEGVPRELIYLAQIESGFYPRAVSYRSAVGMWQFIRDTGRLYGLAQTPYTDDRLDPEKATRAAAKHLHDLYNQFGDWYLAMAAYNCGPMCVDKAVERTGYADFWKLRDIGVLPKETTNYVPVIVAITIMMKNAKDYGLDQIRFDAPLEYDSIKIESPTNVTLIADVVERPVTEVRDLNPALLSSVAPAGFDVRVPKGTSQSVLATLDSVPANRRANSRIHKVEAGETLASIAKRFGVSPNSLAPVEGTLDAPSAGDILLIPIAEPRPAARYAKSPARRGTPVQTASRGRGTAVRQSASPIRKASYTPRVAPKVLHKKATLKTAGLR